MATESKTFELNDKPFIELNKLLKLLGLSPTGGEANQSILGGEVLVNDAVEIQKRKKLRTGDKVVFKGATVTIK